MIQSMTGFARSETEIPSGVLVWELRTVNHRYLDMVFRLPESLRSAEADFRARAEARLRRGRLDAALRLERREDASQSLEVDPDAVENLVAVMSALGDRLPAARSPSLGELMQWPGLLRRPEADPGALSASAMAGLDEALNALCRHRAREGERIEEMLRSRCKALADEVAGVRQHLPEVQKGIREKYRQRLAQLDVEADPARLEQELAFVAQKMDVDEELDRLESHLAEFTDVLGRDEAVGRRLDFLMQEFNREANTLASKSQDVRTTNASVEMKVLMEQMREQIQNVE